MKKMEEAPTVPSSMVFATIILYLIEYVIDTPKIYMYIYNIQVYKICKRIMCIYVYIYTHTLCIYIYIYVYYIIIAMLYWGSPVTHPTMGQLSKKTQTPRGAVYACRLTWVARKIWRICRTSIC